VKEKLFHIENELSSAKEDLRKENEKIAMLEECLMKKAIRSN